MGALREAHGKILFTCEGTERNSGRMRLENFYYAAIYDVIQEPIQYTQKMSTLKMLKAKILCLNSTFRQKLKVDTGEQDKMSGEYPSLHHLIKTRKRQARRTIRQICDDEGITHAESMDIMKVFTMHFRKKFCPIRIDEGSARLLLNCELRTVTHEMNSVLEEPISLDELRNAISKGRPHKAPGHDGRGLRFYKMAWKVMTLDLLQIINCLYSDGIIVARQLQGIIVCIPNIHIPLKVTSIDP